MPIDFGFNMKSLVKQTMTNVRVLRLKDVPDSYVMHFDKEIRLIFESCDWIRAVTFKGKEDWEVMIYGFNQNPAVNPQGEFCLNTELLEAGNMIFDI